MEPQKLKSHTGFFEDMIIFDQICEFLTIKEVLTIGVVSKALKDIIQYACRHRLSHLQLNLISNKSSTRQMQFYFNRCLRIVKEDSDKPVNLTNHIGNNQLDKVTTKIIHYPFKFEVIKFFQVGPTHTVYLTMDDKARIFRTKQLIESLHEQNPKDIFQEGKQYDSKSNIKDIKCKSDSTVITKNNGEVSLVTILKNIDEDYLKEENLLWTSKIPIKRVAASFNYSIFIPEHKLPRAIYLKEIFEINETNIDEMSSDIQEISKTVQNQETEKILTLVVRNMLNGRYILIHLQCEEILDCAVGNKNAYFITQNHEVMSVDFDLNNDQHFYQIHAQKYQPFSNKKIVKITSGFNFFIALERNLQNLPDWDNERVIQWLREIGFDGFIKIAKVEKLDGKKLKNIEKKYMHNVLGITKLNMQQKFIMSIEEHLKKIPRNDKLYGWGKNQFGQLGSSSANYIVKPQRIRVNCLKPQQYIDSVFCGWYQTFIRTQKGRIYCTVTKTERKKKKEDRQQKVQEKMALIEYSSDDDNNNFRMDGVKRKSQKNPNRKRKKTVQIQISKDKKHHKFQEQQNWYESSVGKSFFVQTYKNTLFFIQCPYHSQQNHEQDKPKKMRTAKAMLDKILWSHLNKEEFKVGYMDKQMGLIEASALEMEMFDVKQNTIRYFKKNGQIIWDRQQKVDLL